MAILGSCLDVLVSESIALSGKSQCRVVSVMVEVREDLASRCLCWSMAGYMRNTRRGVDGQCGSASTPIDAVERAGF
jgi:hypothetical protein